MAKQRPTLDVPAAPVSTYVSSVAPAVELYDQQSVRLALEFADAFKDLSVTAATLAGTLKREQNEEDVQAGIDLVNQSQKSYKDLMDSGEIKPTENPWMAVGAQQASGTREGMLARSHFMEVYNKRAEEDPKFFDSPEGFSALASQYTTNVNSFMEGSPYQSRAFYEAFNPFIASMSVKHEEQMTQARQRKVVGGMASEVVKAMDDIGSPDPIVSNAAIGSLQEAMDNMGRMGYGSKLINESVVDALVNYATTSDYPERAEKVLQSLKSGTGNLGETEYAKTALSINRAKIDSNKSRLTVEEAKQFSTWWGEVKGQAVSGKITQEQLREQFDAFTSGPDRKISISGPEAESKWSFVQSDLQRALKEAEALKEQQQEDVIFGIIGKSAEIPPDFVGDESDYRRSLEESVKKKFDEYEINPQRRMQYLDILDRQFAQSANRRAENLAEQNEKSLWNGVTDGNGVKQPGLSEQFDTELLQFFGLTKDIYGKPVRMSSEEAAKAAGTVPSFEEYRRKIDASRAASGMTEEQIKRNYERDYRRFNQQIKTMEQVAGSQMVGGTLQASETDPPEVRDLKRQYRGQFRFLRLRLASTFESKEEARFNAVQYNNILSVAEAERGQNVEPFTDMLNAFVNAQNNGMDLEQIVLSPESSNGKRMLEEMYFALSEYRNGKQPTDIMRDLSRGRVFGQELQTNFYDRKNPFGWLQFTDGSGIDGEDFNKNMTKFRENINIAENDAYMYFASEYYRYYREAVSGPAMGDGEKGNEYAIQKLQQNNIVFRGSVIPKTKLNGSIDDTYLEEWVKAKYPKNPNATLVVVQRNPDGTALLSPRENGMAISNDIFPSTDLNPLTFGPEIIKQFGAEENKRRMTFQKAIETESAATRRVLRMGRPKVGEPKF